jgi:hypothetical protein
MERGKWPIFHGLDIAMLNGIVVDIVEIALLIPLVPDSVLPIPALPNSPFAFALTGLRYPLPSFKPMGES